jgi:hypothetical protein
MATLTPNQKLAGMLLGKPVKDYIAERRAAGRSWRLVSRDLYEATNGQIDITGEAARLWAMEEAA